MSTLKSLTLASILEFQGHKDDALAMYRDLLKDEPSSKEAQAAIRRLSGMRRKYHGVNTQMKEYFIQMSSDDEIKEFERWLIALWI
jgi:hypothetical protein